MSEQQDKILTHLDDSGRVHMVDVGDKPVTSRRAKAGGYVLLSEDTLGLIMEGKLKKGEALELARVAGIMAAKKTADLIPLCHPLQLSHVNLEITPLPGQGRIRLLAEVRCEGRTGVEMEALTAVAAAGLTIYDMAKAVDKNIVLTDIMLLEKMGGRSGIWTRS